MPVGVISWSKTAAANAGSDTTINWAEGQAPSSINDSARAMMASIAKWRDDIGGVLVSGGSSTAFAITSNQGTPGSIDGVTIQFVCGLTNTGPVTLQLDGSGAAPLRFYTGVELPAGALISGSIYRATCRLASGEWLLHAFDASLYAIPIGASFEYWGSSAPNGAFAIPNGQAISRALFAPLFGIIGTTYGPGDGSSTFNLPNPAGRAVVQRELSANLLSPGYFGDSTALGAMGGGQNVTLNNGNLPPYTPTGHVTVSNVGVAYNVRNYATSGTSDTNALSLASNIGASAGTISSVSGSATGSFTGDPQVGNNSNPLRTIQPTIIANRLMRIA